MMQDASCVCKIYFAVTLDPPRATASLFFMRTVLAVPGWRGVDTTQVLTLADCQDLKASGVDYVERYLASLTGQEILNIFAANLLLGLVSYSRKKGWIPSASLGTLDAQGACAQARALGIPQGATLQCDLETPGGTSQDVIAYGKNEGSFVSNTGFGPGVYVGAGTLLTSAELYALPYNRYVKSCSRVTDRFGNIAEPECGWVAYQLFPPDLVRVGVEVDLNVTQNDFEGRALVLVGP